MLIWDWSAKQGVLKCMWHPLVPSIVLVKEIGCPTTAKQLQAVVPLFPVVPCGDETPLGSTMAQQAQVLALKAPSPAGSSKQGCVAAAPHWGKI